ncbi:Hsp20/alpha crystallin family protein [Marivirga sp. S37H4]|uniref:Hsp20/alpha crystallin family protein n=1 Tax=Marivirga aurantiaca TaxID=2802615 RepID=A0A934WZR1_9BACT|nr:Hsp20/alpha crystallin family protein [Marivirga aurantiaca]MBK6265745.1 Hsp20/alpha crystallin family protein [Marivirga aurantiaca]
MTLIKYDQGLPNVANRSFSNFLDRFFNESFVNANKEMESFNPQVDVAEGKKEFELSVAVPGMKKSDFNIDMSDGKITISGERKFENEKDGKNYHSVETKYGAFSRTFYLPDNILEDKVEASYQDGILKVIIPKDEKKELKKTIQIK